MTPDFKTKRDRAAGDLVRASDCQRKDFLAGVGQGFNAGWDACFAECQNPEWIVTHLLEERAKCQAELELARTDAICTAEELEGVLVERDQARAEIRRLKVAVNLERQHAIQMDKEAAESRGERDRYRKALEWAKSLISWLRDGIEHFTHEDDRRQVEHLQRHIDDRVAKIEELERGDWSNNDGMDPNWRPDNLSSGCALKECESWKHSYRLLDERRERLQKALEWAKELLVGVVEGEGGNADRMIAKIEELGRGE